MDRTELKDKILETYNNNNNFGRFLGMNFEVIEPGLVHYFLTINKDLLATPTAAHGGVLAAFMDAIVSVAALSDSVIDGNVVSTIEFKINYLKPALLDDNIKGIGTVIRKGKSIIVSRGEIFNSKKELIAVGTGTMNSYPVEKSSF